MPDPGFPVANCSGLRPNDLPYAHGGPIGTGHLKSVCEDFVVDESLGFDCSGQGEHLFLRIEKRGLNTEDVARRLARFGRVKSRDVGFAGMKDRHAVARQWLSVRLPQVADKHWTDWDEEGLEVLEVRRHSRKLKRGSLASNGFRIRIRNVDAPSLKLEHLLDKISRQGIPNYYGPQRFGWGGGNIDEAGRFFSGSHSVKGRYKKGLLLSTARSVLFNILLSRRIEDGNWNQAIAGDALMFEGSNSYFRTTVVGPNDSCRVAEGELHPTGVLWGTGSNEVSARALEYEERLCVDYPLFCRGLEEHCVVAARRSFRLFPQKLQWHIEPENVLVLEFSLPAGGYATSVIREILNV